jgi:hypothetical protein
MAHEIKLEVYTLRLRRKSKDNKDNDEYLKIDNFFNNVDFLDFFEKFINNFGNEMIINEDYKKSFQFQQEFTRIDRKNRKISGIIESGDYGLDGKIVNTKSGRLNYHKSTEDTDIKPFYFLVIFPENSNKGFVVLQRTGIYGINSVFKSHLELFFKKEFTNLMIEISQFVSKNLANKFLNNGGVRELTLRRYNLPSDVIEKLGMTDQSEDILSVEFKIVSKRKKSFVGFNKRITKFIKATNGSFFDLPELSKLGFDDKAQYSVKIKLGNSTRTIDLSEHGQIRPYFDVEDHVDKDPKTGHPIFESIDKFAIELVNDLLLEIVPSK